MIRIFTFLTVNANGEPTAAGTYFDPVIADLDVDPSNNQLIIPIRDGTETIIADPQTQFEVRGTLNYSKSHVDLESVIQYLGSDRYLSTVLYHHHRNKLPIAIFHSNITGTPKKCYVGKLLTCDKTVEAAATEDTTVPLFWERHSVPSLLTYQMKINLDGIYTDVDDITTAAWSLRT